MRLLRISLVAFVAMTLTTGCAATRNRLSSLRDHDRDASATEDHEYSPRAGESSGDDFRNPSGEPVPAPPAMGISRVKSVSFLRDISDKFHGRKDDCGLDCVDDSELVGQCSPVEPCVPTDDHNKRVHRYVDRYYSKDNNTSRLNPLRSFQKSIGKVFHGKPSADCSSECTEIQDEPGCNAPQKVCDQSRRPLRVYSEQGNSQPSVQPSSPLRPRPTRNGDGLAAPMEDHDLHNEPGLITPNNQIRTGDIPALPIPDQPVPSVPEVPAVPEAVTPPVQPPAPVPQVEDLPAPPVLPPGTTQSVEPPVWPRLQGPNKQVSLPSTIGTKQVNSGPMVIQPRPSR